MAKSEGKQPLVEVIILTHNGKENIKKCLNSLKKTNYKNIRVSVVDQDSRDGTSEIIKKNYKWVNLVRNNRNKSFTEGNNDLLKFSKAKYCILLNDDTEQDRDWIKELVEVAEKDKEIGALQPKVLSMKNRKEFEYAGAAGGFVDIYGFPVCRGRVFDDIEQDRGQYDDLRQVFWSCGVAMFLNMSVLKKIGYLDETFGSYAEELDLSWRMNLAGFKVIFVPKAKVYHLGSASWGKAGSSFGKGEYLNHRNHWIPLFKNYSRKTWVKILPQRLFLDFFAIGGFFLSNPRKSLAVLKGLGWVLNNLGVLAEKNKKIERLKKVPDKIMERRMIKKSVALRYFLTKSNRKFVDFVKHIEEY